MIDRFARELILKNATIYTGALGKEIQLCEPSKRHRSHAQHMEIGLHNQPPLYGWDYRIVGQAWLFQMGETMTSALAYPADEPAIFRGGKAQFNYPQIKQEPIQTAPEKFALTILNLLEETAYIVVIIRAAKTHAKVARLCILNLVALGIEKIKLSYLQAIYKVSHINPLTGWLLFQESQEQRSRLVWGCAALFQHSEFRSAVQSTPGTQAGVDLGIQRQSPKFGDGDGIALGADKPPSVYAHKSKRLEQKTQLV